jgi:hypothetical protein
MDGIERHFGTRKRLIIGKLAFAFFTPPALHVFIDAIFGDFLRITIPAPDLR